MTEVGVVNLKINNIVIYKYIFIFYTFFVLFRYPGKEMSIKRSQLIYPIRMPKKYINNC